MKKKLPLILLLIFLGAVYATYLIYQDYGSLVVHLWNLVPPLIASLSAFYAIRIYGRGNPHAKALSLLSLGIFFWFLGEFIWFILEFFFHSYPFPSIADFFYLLAYPVLLAGLIVEFKNNKIKWTPLRLTVCVSKCIVFALLVIYFGIIKTYDPGEALTSNLIAMSYGVGDLVLIILSSLILMIALNYQKGRLFVPWALVFSGFVLILISDILFAMYQEAYENLLSYARNIDLGWITGFSLLALGFYKIGESIEDTKKKLLGIK